MSARLGYDQPAGAAARPWRLVEFIFKDAFFAENANLLKAPGYELVNLNLTHRDIAHDYIRSMTLFFEVKNVFDKTYVGPPTTSPTASVR